MYNSPPTCYHTLCLHSSHTGISKYETVAPFLITNLVSLSFPPPWSQSPASSSLPAILDTMRSLHPPSSWPGAPGCTPFLYFYLMCTFLAAFKNSLCKIHGLHPHPAFLQPHFRQGRFLRRGPALPVSSLFLLFLPGPCHYYHHLTSFTDPQTVTHIHAHINMHVYTQTHILCTHMLYITCILYICLH